MNKYTNSWWGIKNTNDDISKEILAVVNSASKFVIVCGYNFTFNSSATSRPFFDALIKQKSSGVKILMIFPPKLHSRFNPQPKIIHHCLTNGIPIILNHQNHSKWLLTDNHIYYGSSNFTNASWKDRVEVISLHLHKSIGHSWAKETIKDFKDFINSEISVLNDPARKMKLYKGLLTSTRTAWITIKSMVQKFNPSIQKVINTLENYDNINLILHEQIVNWFEFYSRKEFEKVFLESGRIANAINLLCEYAYGNIYNETVQGNNIEVDQFIVNDYNILWMQVNLVINNALENLPDRPAQFSDLATSNISKINATGILLDGF